MTLCALQSVARSRVVRVLRSAYPTLTGAFYCTYLPNPTGSVAMSEGPVSVAISPVMITNPNPAVSSADDEEMAATERELAEDAQWKRIQQNTFTRWANEHLKTVSKHIGNLETDLCDGLRLITLIEVLSGRQLPKHTKRPTFRSQKLENVSVALKFLTDDEGIKIVNIGESRLMQLLQCM